ncbi:MAG: 2-dehydro-3-deoxy-6-phosphogalactonate aldolase [Pseudomonadota bacterium]
MMSLRQALDAAPLIAILRGLLPENAVDTAAVLVEAGFRVIEVPLNSPDPFDSIARIADRFSDVAVVGAGTVLSAQDVAAVQDAGGRIVVAPNMNTAVGQAAVDRDLDWCPGVFTPSEAFAALDLGASVLKFFPAEIVPPTAIGAMRAVLPRTAIVAAVGGIVPEKMSPYWDKGADAFGLGSALFKPDYALEDVRARAQGFMDAVSHLKARS